MSSDITLAHPVPLQIDREEQTSSLVSDLGKPLNSASSTIRPSLCNYISRYLPQPLYALVKQDSSSVAGKPEALHLAFEGVPSGLSCLLLSLCSDPTSVNNLPNHSTFAAICQGHNVQNSAVGIAENTDVCGTWFPPSDIRLQQSVLLINSSMKESVFPNIGPTIPL